MFAKTGPACGNHLRPLQVIPALGVFGLLLQKQMVFTDVNTGECKSATTSAYAFALARHDRTVEIVTLSRVLVTRNCDVHVRLFAVFGVSIAVYSWMRKPAVFFGPRWRMSTIAAGA
jgi:hypothetical protein